jgi:exopolyphosphatase/guanosine-5'-triphosphate,3'-diphosphate pyrophosphatase
MGKVLAAVDIGSNTVHLLVAGTQEGSVQRLCDENEWLNLGEIVAERGDIPLPVQDRLIDTLVTYRGLAKQHRASRWYIFGTEAMRKARNSEKVLKRVKAEVGADVELVTGQREAELGVAGVLVDSDEADEMMLAEVGGGSAQVAFVKDQALVDDASLPIGTGALNARFHLTFPTAPGAVDALTEHVREALATGTPHPTVKRVVASGGVARGLWRAVHPDGEREVAIEELDYLIWSTQRLNRSQIELRFQVKPRRAATLLTGAIIFREVLKRYKQPSMLVSRFGVREGAVLEMARGRIKGWTL